MVLVTVMYIVIKKLKKLPVNAETVSVYLFAINSSYVTEESKNGMQQFIELGDWEMAEHWKEKTMDDFKHKRGIKDKILKSIDIVYRPLHENVEKIEWQYKNNYHGNLSSGVKDDWYVIKEKGFTSLIEDTELRKHVVDLYDKLESYGKMTAYARNKLPEIVRNVIKIRYSDVVVTSQISDATTDMPRFGFRMLYEMGSIYDIHVHINSGGYLAAGIQPIIHEIKSNTIEHTSICKESFQLMCDDIALVELKKLHSEIGALLLSVKAKCKKYMELELNL